MTGLGVSYLPTSWGKDPPVDLETLPGLSDSNMLGMASRGTWERNEQVKGQYIYTFYDSCKDYAETYNKWFSLQLLAGKSCPKWFYDEPNVTCINAGSDGKLCSLVFDPVWQSYWQKVMKGFAKRYGKNSRLKFVRLGGVGIASESFVTRTPEELAQAEDAARKLGYPDFLTAWKAGTQWNIDMMAHTFAPIPVVLITGSPNGEDDGRDALQEMFDYGNREYCGHFGAASHDLSGAAPKEGTFTWNIINQLSPYCSAVGYQAGGAQIDPQRVTDMCDIAIEAGAHFMEPFMQDCDDKRNSAAFANTNDVMVG